LPFAAKAQRCHLQLIALANAGFGSMD
jgi:hypothetical protein